MKVYCNHCCFFNEIKYEEIALPFICLSSYCYWL
jgi:hypothetical protein